MGSSPSADLFYGYDLGDLTDPSTYDDLAPQWMRPGDGDDGEEADERLARLKGWVEVPFSADVRNGDPAAYKAWADSRAEMRALAEAAGVELAHYGYLEDPAYCLRVKASHQGADDYGSTPLQPLAVDPAWDGLLAEYVQLMEFRIPDGATPGWHMNCSYG